MTLVACVVQKKIIINSANVTEMDVAEKSKSSFIMHLVQKKFLKKVRIWHAKRALVAFELVSHTICHTFFLFPSTIAVHTYKL